MRNGTLDSNFRKENISVSVAVDLISVLNCQLIVQDENGETILQVEPINQRETIRCLCSKRQITLAKLQEVYDTLYQTKLKASAMYDRNKWENIRLKNFEKYIEALGYHLFILKIF